MTDLEKAIAEVAAHAPWHFQMLETSGDPSCDRAVVAILNAVVSGELVPAAERDADVAAALVAAAKHIVSEADRLIEPKMPSAEGAMKYLHDLADEVLAMINQPQADALARVRADTVKAKPLVWNDGGSAEFPLRAEGYWIDSPRHDYAVLHANGRLFSNGQNKIVFRGNLACHQAKAAAQADHDARIRAEIGGVE